MISILPLRSSLCAGLLLLLLPLVSVAQSAQSLSVSPTLFNMSANPGQTWQSALRVINSNPYDLTVNVTVVNFAPEGESGQGRFIPFDGTDDRKDTFAEWVQIENPERTIPAEQTAEVPFTITVPDDAPPGGHSVALLVGTRPTQAEGETTSVETSQIISSLVFLRVAGDVIETGGIREFRTSQWILERPETNFILRFENDGNVHLRPQGEIKIYNMWGQERGVVQVNQQSLFGNVLPKSIRAYTFGWEGEWSPLDIGRYQAIATLAFGEEARQTVSSETAFWIIPWKVITAIVLVLGGFIALIAWGIKVYIRYMLALAQPNAVSVPKSRKRMSVVAPIEVGILDLRARLKEEPTASGRLQTLTSFIKQYRLFFIVVIAVMVFIALIFWFIQTVSVDYRGYQITTDPVLEE